MKLIEALEIELSNVETRERIYLKEIEKLNSYVLEMYYSKDSGRTLLKNVPCKYADRVQSAVRAGNRIHQHPRNISVYDE